MQTINLGSFDYHSMSLNDVMKVIFDTVPLDRTGSSTYVCAFEVGSWHRAIVQAYSSHAHMSAIVFSYSIDGVIVYVRRGGIDKRFDTQWNSTNF